MVPNHGGQIKPRLSNGVVAILSAFVRAATAA
jgi:hypothetical protein